MPDRHKHGPIPFRPPEGDRARLLAYAERTEQPVNRILAEALTVYLEFLEAAERDPDSISHGPCAESTATIPERQRED